MSIEEIKDRLSISQVLSHYGLSPNHSGMLECPFHDDQKPSMKVYHETNTVFCFAGGCGVKSLDVIDFIMKMEKLSKREAILKAKALTGDYAPILVNPPIKKERIMSSKTNKLELFQQYQISFNRSKPAKLYCNQRSLDYKVLEIGYKSSSTADKWGKQCLIFPLRNGKGEIVSFYGRSVINTGHYYQTGRSGLYPSYPINSTKKMILFESIIDCASLLQLEEFKDFTLLALYGTNGLTAEHMTAIKSLKDLEEISFFFDNDKPGQQAVKKYALQLKEWLPHVKMSNVLALEGEDANQILQGHTPAILIDAVAGRTDIVLSTEASPPKNRPKETTEIKREFNASNPYNIKYVTSTASYVIKGGVRYGFKDLDNLKVTLEVSNKEKKKSRNRFDLYDDKQLEKMSRYIGGKLNLSPGLIEFDLQCLIDELEKYRDEQQAASQAGNQAQKPQARAVCASDKIKCMELLKSKDLMQKLDKLLESYGIIGEENNRKIGLCIASSYGMKKPLHGLIQGSSGSGKTHLMTALCSLIPTEFYIPITRATNSSFYNFTPYELSHKLISIEDKDSMSEEANLAFREMQSKGMVSSSTTGQDEQGNNKSFIKVVFGPIASLACTTQGEIYQDDMNRCFLLAVDESPEQTQRILAAQQREAAGEQDETTKNGIRHLIQNCLRLLKAYRVVIPYATQLSLPDYATDKRRLNYLYLCLVKQITILYQYQRSKDSKGRLISTKEDLTIANKIMFDAIVLKCDELHGSLRNFFEQLKKYLSSQSKNPANYSFRQREIRQNLHLSKSWVAKFIKELLEMEYIEIISGSDRRGYTYKISYWDDNAALRARIKGFLQNQIDMIES